MKTASIYPKKEARRGSDFMFSIEPSSRISSPSLGGGMMAIASKRFPGWQVRRWFLATRLRNPKVKCSARIAPMAPSCIPRRHIWPMSPMIKPYVHALSEGSWVRTASWRNEGSFPTSRLKNLRMRLLAWLPDRSNDAAFRVRAWSS